MSTVAVKQLFNCLKYLNARRHANRTVFKKHTMFANAVLLI